MKADLTIEQSLTVPWRDAASGKSKVLAVLWAPTAIRAADDAVTVVMCHGYGSGKRNRMYLLMRELQRRIPMDLIAFDFEGHYDSEGDKGDLTLSRGVSQLDAVMSHKALQSAFATSPILVGSSFGATVGLLYQFLNKHFAKLILRSPISDYVEVRRLQVGDAGLTQWQREGVMEIEGIASSYAFIEDARMQCLYDRITQLDSPIYLIHGDADDNVPVSQSVELARRLRAPNVLWLAHGADHGYQGQSQQRVLETFLEWSLGDESVFSEVTST